MTKIDTAKLDEIAKLEVEAILEGLNDPELRSSPAFLARVRQFMKENRLETQPETPGVTKLIRDIHEIPNFDIQ